MANIIGIMGESGAGKTTSMRNLDPKTTYYFDCDKKGLSWKGWKGQYNEDNKNYVKTDVPETVLRGLQYFNKDATHIKTVVVDTINGLMVADEMRRMREKGFDKWQDLASSIYNILDYALTMREDLNIIFIAHAQIEKDDNGNMFSRIKTNGKKLDKICLESKLTTVLYAKTVDGKYIFELRANNSTAKCPMGYFEGVDTIDNDIVAVIEEFNN